MSPMNQVFGGPFVILALLQHVPLASPVTWQVFKAVRMPLCNVAEFPSRLLFNQPGLDLLECALHCERSDQSLGCIGVYFTRAGVKGTISSCLLLQPKSKDRPRPLAENPLSDCRDNLVQVHFLSIYWNAIRHCPSEKNYTLIGQQEGPVLSKYRLLSSLSFMVGVLTDWKSGADECSKDGGKLAEISSPKELGFVTQLLLNAGCCLASPIVGAYKTLGSVERDDGWHWHRTDAPVAMENWLWATDRPKSFSWGKTQAFTYLDLVKSRIMDVTWMTWNFFLCECLEFE